LDYVCGTEYSVAVRVVIDEEKSSHSETVVSSCYEAYEIVGLVGSRVVSFRLHRRGGSGRETAAPVRGDRYAGDSPDKLCLILSTPQGLEVRNESGGRSVLVYDPPNSVRAVDWEGGLRGEIHNDRILWANGTW
jgi:hypothetical protein